MRWIDTHAHVYSEELKPDLEGVVRRALLEGIDKIYMPAIDSSCTDAMLALETKYPQLCIAMMGLHPCYVKENYQAELKLVEQWLAQRKFCAIGEIGLDFYWDKTFVAQQHEAFKLQMQWEKR